MFVLEAQVRMEFGPIIMRFHYSAVYRLEMLGQGTRFSTQKPVLVDLLFFAFWYCGWKSKVPCGRWAAGDSHDVNWLDQVIVSAPRLDRDGAGLARDFFSHGARPCAWESCRGSLSWGPRRILGPKWVFHAPHGFGWFWSH